MGKRGASSRYIAAGLVSTEIAEKVTALSGCTKMSEMVLVMSEKRLEHANSEKHHKTGVGLSVEDYASISRIIANPSMVIWDKDNQNLIYLNDDKTIKVIVDSPNKDKIKPREKVDAVINVYRVNRNDIDNAIRGGVYTVIK